MGDVEEIRFRLIWDRDLEPDPVGRLKPRESPPK